MQEYMSFKDFYAVCSHEVKFVSYLFLLLQITKKTLYCFTVQFSVVYRHASGFVSLYFEVTGKNKQDHSDNANMLMSSRYAMFTISAVMLC